MDALHFHSRVGGDGVLDVHIDLGAAEAERDVLITVKPVRNGSAGETTRLEWNEFIDKTYGSCAGLDLRRQLSAI
jgi:hypothetical protein